MRTMIPDAGKFVWIWEKYRPAILQLMKASSDSPQDYKLSSHEFKDVNNKKPSGYSFVLKAYQSRGETNVKKSPNADDLLRVLNSSGTARELMDVALFEFELDKNFVLHVRKEEVEQVAAKEEEAPEDEAKVEEAEAKEAKVEDVEAKEVEVEEVEAKEAEVEEAEAKEAKVEDVEAKEAKVEDVEAKEAEVEEVEAKEAKVKKAETKKAKIKKVEAKEEVSQD